MSSKKTKAPKHFALQGQVASLKIGPPCQRPSQSPSLNENHKAKARATYPTASPKLQKHSYSEIAQKSGTAQDRSNKGPLQKVTSKQWNTQSQKPVISAKTSQLPSQLRSVGGKGQPKTVNLKQNPIHSANSREETPAQRQFQPSRLSIGPHEGISNKSKAEESTIGCTQRHNIPGPDPLKFDVKYTETNRGSNFEQTKHTTIAKAHLPFHRKSSSLISLERRRQSINYQDRQQLLESEEDSPAKNDYRHRKSPTGS